MNFSIKVTLSRREVVKKLWGYIKKQNLHDRVCRLLNCCKQKNEMSKVKFTILFEDEKKEITAVEIEVECRGKGTMMVSG